MGRIQRTRRRLRSDPQFRAIVIQWAVLVGVLTVAGFALRNVAVNLAAIGKDFSFDFLLAPASYEITFSPFLEYSSRDTHLKAALVGLLNTVLVTVTGIVAATVLGFAMGIARLSQNWLVNRTAYVILDFVRNVPLFAAHPVDPRRDRVGAPRSESGARARRDCVRIEPGALPPHSGGRNGALGGGRGRGCWRGSGGGTLLVGAGVATPHRAVDPGRDVDGGTRARADGRRVRRGRGSRRLGGTSAHGLQLRGGLGVKPEFLALWAALSGYTACFIGEAVRGGIVAVGKGQMEAGLALGLRPLATLRLVVVPQAARMMVPPIVNQYLNLTKDSSLAIAIGYMDVVATIGGISLMQTGRELETMIIILGVYLALSLTIALSMRRFHRTTRRRAGRETQARARRAPSVAMRFEEAVAVREVAVRRIGVGSLARLWEAGEQACESGGRGCSGFGGGSRDGRGSRCSNRARRLRRSTSRERCRSTSRVSRFGGNRIGSGSGSGLR